MQLFYTNRAQRKENRQHSTTKNRLALFVTTPYCLFTICALLMGLTAQAQITLQDAWSHQAIAGVHIYNSQQTFAATSDSSGQFTFNPSKLQPSDTLFFQHLSYQLESVPVRDISSENDIIELYAKEEMLPDMVISVGRVAEKLSEVSNQVSVLKAKDIALSNAQTSASLLQSTGSVYVQKSQMGGGSPVIRGFEANKVLIVVDGVRLNNAIYRGGHLQNVITIDPSILERTEVVFGPGSVIYGSDALGGVMHFITKKPTLAKDKQRFVVKGNVMGRFATVNNEQSTHLDLSLGGRKFGSLTSLSYSDFGDLRIGRWRLHGHEGWGQRFAYVNTNGGEDVLVDNPHPNQLRFTGYQQFDLLQKFYYEPTENIDVIVNLQYSTSSNIPRFDRLNDPKNPVDDFDEPWEEGEGLKSAEWYYGPQNRWMASLNTSIRRATPLFDQLNLVAAFQRIDEDRIDRKFGKITRRHREEDVQVYTFNADFVKKMNQHRWQYGLEGTHNVVNSTGYLEDITNGERLGDFVATRYPDGGSNMSTAAAYLRHKWRINDQFILTEGVRYSYVRLHANFIDTTLIRLPFQSTTDRSQAFTGSIGLLYKPTYQTKINLTFATGFRSPNIDDATKVFDPNDDIVVVPNLTIQPEYAYNGELGIEQTIASRLKFRTDFYYTYLTNLIKRSPFTLADGIDSLVFDGSLRGVFANVNAGKAVVAGVAFSTDFQVSPRFSILKKINYTYGQDVTNDQPLGHIPPLFGQLKLKYINEAKTLNAHFWVDYNGAKRIKRYSPNSEDKREEALATGTPAWFTLNANMSYQIIPNIALDIGIENMLDVHYKPFASGISGGGRNVVIAVRGSF